ncbi:response regulator [Bacteroides sp. GM023]|uniref:hybrid sensor histidine kinase/response regulator n=1 Tax=Bacteroides sp. GM023 TaxID=2723058 RepID=UPI00168BC593|nr:response regulator [Bacteroides sp. GM023]MBD3587952.1 response regulator [Bacteroides sp. GM023]
MGNESPLALLSGAADNLLYNIFENLSVGLELYDKSGLMIEVNHTELQSMGIKNREELLGRSLFDIPSLSDKDKQQIMNGETIHLLAEYDFDKLHRCFPTYLSGTKHFEITVSSVFSEEGKIINYLVITQDITERILWQRKYENLYEDALCSKQELIKSEQKMIELLHHNELVLNNTNSGLAYITNDYIVQWENVSLCSRSLSYEAYRKGEACYKTAHNRTTPCENCVMQRARKSGQVETIQFLLNNEHTIEVFATPVYNDLGDIEGVVIRVDDVTERQQMIGELEKARKQAEQSDKLKSAFLANMSHEIRTPLNAIVGFSDLLMITDNPAEKEEYSKIININNELLLKLINDILDLSKIEAGSVELKYEEFDLSVYFDELATSMQWRIGNPQVRLITVNPYAACMVRLDKKRFAQILTNYVTNAIKYTPEGTIEMGYEKVEEGIRIYVRDTGIGIPEDKKDKVFYRFEKLDEFAQGTGLGLSICKAIIDACEGSIGFESEHGKGSLFWAILPCIDEIEEEGLTASQQRSGRKSRKDAAVAAKEEKVEKKTILVAEDIQSNFSLVSSLLKNRCNLLHAANGQKAVEIVQTQSVDLVLMDMKMPIMDGRIATAEIRKFNTRIPILALTAHAFEADRVAALEVGCDDYLVKPINGAKLMQALKEYGC